MRHPHDFLGVVTMVSAPFDCQRKVEVKVQLEHEAGAVYLLYSSDRVPPFSVGSRCLVTVRELE